MNTHRNIRTATLPDGPLPYPFPRTDILRPHPYYRLLRHERPVAEIVLSNGTPAHLVTRYDDVRTVLEDARFSRVALSRAAPQELVAYTPPRQAEDPGASNHSMPYELLNRWFTPRAVERLRQRTRQITDELLNVIAVRSPPIDLVPALTAAVPMTVIGELAGIPVPDRKWILDRAPLVTVDSPDAQSKRASSEVFDYFRKALDARRGTRTDDLLGHLLTVSENSDEKIPEDKLTQLAMRTCLPGFHSVSVTLSKGIPILLRQPEIYAELGTRDDAVPAVVEEILRLTTPASGSLPRLTLSDVELAGVTIPAGRVVVGSLESANTDERKYPDPGRIIPERGIADHTTFGRGRNFCFGAALSRMELQVVVSALPRKLPTLRLAVPEEHLPVRAGAIAPDVLELPVCW